MGTLWSIIFPEIYIEMRKSMGTLALPAWYSKTDGCLLSTMLHHLPQSISQPSYV
jgi:hypothetical protein